MSFDELADAAERTRAATTAWDDLTQRAKDLQRELDETEGAPRASSNRHEHRHRRHVAHCLRKAEAVVSLKWGLVIYVLALLLVWALCIAAADGAVEEYPELGDDPSRDWDGAFEAERAGWKS